MIIKDRGEVPILEEWGCLEWFFLRGIVRHFWSVFGVVVESRSRLMISVSIWAISPFFFVFLQILTLQQFFSPFRWITVMICVLSHFVRCVRS